MPRLSLGETRRSGINSDWGDSNETVTHRVNIDWNIDLGRFNYRYFVVGSQFIVLINVQNDRAAGCFIKMIDKLAALILINEDVHFIGLKRTFFHGRLISRI